MAQIIAICDGCAKARPFYLYYHGQLLCSRCANEWLNEETQGRCPILADVPEGTPLPSFTPFYNNPEKLRRLASFVAGTIVGMTVGFIVHLSGR